MFGKQIPSLSFVNCTSHHRMTFDKLVCSAVLYAKSLESGYNPENPPRAMTNGGLPAKRTCLSEFQDTKDRAEVLSETKLKSA